jgi:hypothetical protein
MQFYRSTMRIELEASLQRWVEAQILDREAAARIRQFERGAAPQRRSRWPAIAAMAFGGAMLAAGILLFVSAHWDRLSPVERMAVLVAAVGGFHTAGAFSASRFRAASITLHAVGTASLGGAIALAGQIFHMQEHWPSAILLWAVGAAIGWALLRDWAHLAIVAVLAPWWLAGEWIEAMRRARAVEPVVACGVLLLAICYLSVRRPGAEDGHGRVALAWLGGLALLPAAIFVAIERHSRGGSEHPVWMALGWAGAIGVPLAIAFVLRGRAAWMNAVAAVWAIALYGAVEARLEAGIFVVCAIGAAGMVGWGIYEFRPERVNLGMAGLALTIVFFFFSSVMDKLGRSASLVALGTVCVAGGWYGEKLRRRLIAQLAQGDPQ